MELVLEITSSEQFLLGENAKKQFLPVGGIIGRSQECDWIIPDQSRHLSGRHAQVSAEGEDFYITDLSTNGVFLNGATNPLEKNRPHKLSSGDTLLMGDIQFRALIHLDATQNGFTPTVGGGVAESSGMQATTLGEGGAEPILDPLEMLRNKMPNALNDSPKETVLGGEQHQLDQWHGDSVSMPDGLAAVQETFDAPAMHSERLPEDWYSIDFSESPPSGGLQSEKISEVPSEVPSERPMPRPGNRSAQVKPEIIPAVDVDPFLAPVDIPAAPAVDAYQAQSFPAVEPTANRPSSQTDAAMRAFCRGLGVPEEVLASVDSLHMMEQAGLALKETFAGMVNVMKGRASLKNEFRMDMTLVQVEKNNPFKFAADEKQVLKHLLNTDKESFLSLPEALREGFSDIQEHQIGVMAAVQASLNQLLGKLDPDRLEERFDRGQAKGFSVLGKRARYWDAYKEYHSDIQQEESTFSSVFGDTFATTYKDQIDRLKAAKSLHQGESQKKQQEKPQGSSQDPKVGAFPTFVDGIEGA